MGVDHAGSYLSGGKFMKNKDLKLKYNDIYKGGAYENYYTFNMFPSEMLIINFIENWSNLEVLDIGCGEGNLAAMLSFKGASKVDGVDYSDEAISIAKERININNVNFLCKDFRKINQKYDVVVMNGVFEHFDNPWKELDFILTNICKKDGIVITTSPGFLNPRGYVWMTLQLLFNVPMSLSDLHQISPFDFEEFCKPKNINLEIISTDQDWGSGERTIIDFNKRLRNALRDAKLNNENVDKLLMWMEKAMPYFERNDLSGAMIAYKLSRK